MPNSPRQPTRRARTLALIGLGVNILLAMSKLLAGIVGNAYALVADAVESIADIIGSAVIWGGLRVAEKPPDESHPYGHGKAEPIAALVVALMIAGAGFGIAFKAIGGIVTSRPPPATWTLWVLLGVVAVKEGLFRLVRAVARKDNSAAVLADAWHHRSDAITSLAAGVGLAIAVIGGPAYASADAWAALAASAIILFNAARLAHDPIHELMDAAPPEVADEAARVASGVPGVRLVEKTLGRKSGRDFLLDMHVQVDPRMSVHDAHGIAHAVKDAVRARMPRVLDVLVHIEPHEPDRESGADAGTGASEVAAGEVLQK